MSRFLLEKLASWGIKILKHSNTVFCSTLKDIVKCLSDELTEAIVVSQL